MKMGISTCNYRWLSVTGLVIALVMLQGSEAARGYYFRKLVDDLFLEYHKDIRPVNNTFDAITVNLTVFLFQILELDEKNQILTAYLWLRQEWTDETLRWNPKKYDGLETIRLPSKNIWLPDTVLYNNADGTFTKNLQTNVILKSNGEIRWDQPAITKTSCQMDVSFFPFDSQSCVFTFGSWTYYLEHVDIVAGQTQGNRDDFIPNVEWKVTDMPVKRIVEQYSCCPDPYPIIQISLELKRKSTFYVFNLLLPCIFISLLLPLTFYLPAESGEKVSLGITTLLAMTVFQLLVAESMPPSEAVPLIGKYYITTMALMSFSTSMTIFVQNIHFCGPNPPPVPRWMKRVILHHSARFLNLKIYVKPSSVEDIHKQTCHAQEYKSKFFGKGGKNKNTDVKVPTTVQIEEGTPFLHDVNASVGSKREKQSKHSRKPNGNCCFGPNHSIRYDGSVRGKQDLSQVNDVDFGDESNKRLQHFTKLRTESRCSWPSLVKHNTMQNRSSERRDSSCGPRSRAANRLSNRQRLSKSQTRDTRPITTLPQTAVPSNNAFSIETSNQVPERRRRNTLVEMNMFGKSFEFSDDTEVSMVTPTYSDSPKTHKFDMSPSKSSTGPRAHRGDKQEGHLFYIESPSWSTTKIGSLSKSQPRLNESMKESCDMLRRSNGCIETMTEETQVNSRFSSIRRRSRDVITRAYKRRCTTPTNDEEEQKTPQMVRFRAVGSLTTPNGSVEMNNDEDVRNHVAEDVSVIADHFRRQRKCLDTADEWKNVSRVLDRALMWTFVIIQILFSTLILCKIL